MVILVILVKIPTRQPTSTCVVGSWPNHAEREISKVQEQASHNKTYSRDNQEMHPLGQLARKEINHECKRNDCKVERWEVVVHIHDSAHDVKWNVM